MSLLALPLGVVVGLVMGALGGGGSILTVPALVYLLGQDPLAATTSSLLIVGVTSVIAVIPQARTGRVRIAEGVLIGVLGTAGSVVGSRLSARVADDVLLGAFAALLLVVAALMLGRGEPPEAADEPPAGRPTSDPVVRLRPLAVDWSRVAALLLTATSIGLLTGFFGVGGGFALVPALVLVLRFPVRVAVGTSLLVMTFNTATALAARAAHGLGHLDWTVVTLFTLTAVAGSLVGGRISARANPHHLTRAFGVLLLAIAVYMGVRSWPALV